MLRAALALAFVLFGVTTPAEPEAKPEWVVVSSYAASDQATGDRILGALKAANIERMACGSRGMTVNVRTIPIRLTPKTPIRSPLARGVAPTNSAHRARLGANRIGMVRTGDADKARQVLRNAGLPCLSPPPLPPPL